MKLLALETATQWCSVALLEAGGTPLARSELAPRAQTDLVLPMVQALLNESGWALSDLDGIAFAHGPGAFTGVRVATSVAQGLAFSAGLPVVGVSTLASCAMSASQEHGPGQWLAAFDARMNQLYVGGYQVTEEGRVSVLIDDALCDPDSLPELPAGSWRGAGDGANVIADSAKGIVDEWFADVAPQAATVAQLAMPRLLAGDTLAPERAAPVYLRNQVIQGAIK